MTDLSHLRELAEHLMRPYVCEGCKRQFEHHPGQRDRDWKRGCPECGARVDVPYAGGDTDQSQVDALEFRRRLTPAVAIAMLDVCEAAGEVEKYNRSDRVSAATYAADAALAEALARLRGAK